MKARVVNGKTMISLYIAALLALWLITAALIMARPEAWS